MIYTTITQPLQSLKAMVFQRFGREGGIARAFSFRWFLAVAPCFPTLKNFVSGSWWNRLCCISSAGGGVLTADQVPAIHPGEILREEYLAPLGMSAGALADVYGKVLNLGNLPPSVLYELAASSTPEPVRQVVEQKIDAGERVSVEEVKRRKRELADKESLQSA